MLGTHNHDLHIHIGAVLASSVTTNSFAFSVNVTTVYYSKAPSAITAQGVIKISLCMSASRSEIPSTANTSEFVLKVLSMSGQTTITVKM